MKKSILTTLLTLMAMLCFSQEVKFKKDIIFVVQELAAQKKLGGIYNLVYPEHPTREKYYLKKAKELNLVAPKFDYTTNIIREIDSNKIQSTLNFKFMHEI